MLFNKKIVVVLPAYKAEKTLKRTFEEIPHEVVDDVLLVDDCSSDGTVALARTLGIKVFVHGEIWNAICSSPVSAGSRIVVHKVDGLQLEVAPLTAPEGNAFPTPVS